jgi:hypothetical protein
MKTSLCTLLESRLIQAVGLLAVIAIIAATSAWSGQNERRVKLEGAWVAQVDNGLRGLVTYAPSDPSGQSAVIRAQMIWPPALLGMMGIDAVTDEIAEEVVTGNKTSQYTGIWYGLAGGTIALICLDNTTCTFVSPTERINVHVGSVYLPAADANNDGYPDPGTSPMMTFTNTSIGRRVAH